MAAATRTAALATRHEATFGVAPRIDRGGHIRMDSNGWLE
jgi:hypothetical protein